jgi:plastocyanin
MRFLAAGLLLLPPQQGGVALAGRVSTGEGVVPKVLAVRYTGPDAKLLKPPDPSPAVVYLVGVPPAKVEPRALELRQSGLEYRPRVAAAPVGSTVRFPCDDETLHNVFSLTFGNDFDHGKFGKGEATQKVFEKKGRVDIRCRIHDHMRAYLFLFDHPYFAVAKEDGSFVIPDVPPGEYTIAAWKEGFAKELRQKVEVKAGASVELKFARHAGTSVEGTALAGCCAAR